VPGLTTSSEPYGRSATSPLPNSWTNFTGNSKQERLPTPLSATPNSRCFGPTAHSTNSSTGRPFSCTPDP